MPGRTTDIGTHYVRHLSAMPALACRLADENPFDYTIPYVRLDLNNLASEYANVCQGIDLTSEKESSDPEMLDQLSYTLSRIIQQLEEAKRDIREFHQRKQLSESQALRTLMQDLESFLSEARLKQNFLRDTTARRVSLFALEESKKSIQQAERSKKLA